MTDIVERLRMAIRDERELIIFDVREAADEIERLKVDCDRLREFNTKLCTEIDLLRGIVRDVLKLP